MNTSHKVTSVPEEALAFMSLEPLYSKVVEEPINGRSNIKKLTIVNVLMVIPPEDYEEEFLLSMLRRDRPKSFLVLVGEKIVQSTPCKCGDPECTHTNLEEKRSNLLSSYLYTDLLEATANALREVERIAAMGTTP